MAEIIDDYAIAGTVSIGQRVIVVREVASTNTALSAMGDKSPSGLVYRALSQTQGRGRQGRSWLASQDDGLAFSVLLRPNLPIEKVSSLPLVFGAAVAKACEELAPTCNVKIKWPNDIHIGGRKLCGILCEMRINPDGDYFVVVGIGINVNTKSFPPEIANIATSLALEGGEQIPLATAFELLIRKIDATYTQFLHEGFAPILNYFAMHDELFGRQITIDTGNPVKVIGIASGLSPDGSLRLLLPNGNITTIYSGDAHILK